MSGVIRGSERRCKDYIRVKWKVIGENRMLWWDMKWVEVNKWIFFSK